MAQLPKAKSNGLGSAFYRMAAISVAAVSAVAGAALNRSSLAARIPLLIGCIGSAILVGWLIAGPPPTRNQLLFRSCSFVVAVTVLLHVGILTMLFVGAGSLVLWKWGSFEQKWARQLLVMAPAMVAVAGTALRSFLG
jgi:hypothetical protein